MKYQNKTFSVSGYKAPESCGHGWLDRRGLCVLCGKEILLPQVLRLSNISLHDYRHKNKTTATSPSTPATNHELPPQKGKDG